MTAPRGARVGVCVDSAAQLPPSLADRLAVEVVPLTLRLDGDEFLEGVDLDLDDWYRRGSTASVEVAAPSPGQFALAFEDLLARGCAEVLSLHAAASLCADPVVPACGGSVKAARLAAHRLGAPVRVLEVPLGGFGVGCGAWVAVEAAEAGASLEEITAIVEATAPRVRHHFLAGPIDLLLRGASDPGGPLLSVRTLDRSSGEGPKVEVVASVASVLDVVNVMSTTVVSAVAPGERVRVAIGHGHPGVEPVAEALEAAIGETVVVDEVLRYRVGATSSALTGPGVVRCFVVPADAFPAAQDRTARPV